MFKLKEKPSGDPAVPERARYTKYYEHDGQLRAYANRSMLMAGLFGVIALVSLCFAIYVSLSRQPSFAFPLTGKRRWSAEGPPGPRQR